MAIERFNLDPVQHEAVVHMDGPLLLDAGPGAGKTRTLIARTAYLIEEQGVSPNGIYLATFTRKARAEMQERLADVLAPGVADHVNVMTIDATAFKILKAVERIRETEVSKEFRVGDDDNLYRHFKEAIDLTEFRSDIMSPRDAWKTMKDWQARGRLNEGMPPDLRALIDHYEEQLVQSRLWDVSDLVPMSMAALRAHPEINAAFNVQAFLLDEYQDTTVMQFEFIKMLIGDCKNFFAVGAPSQSIYGFRFADYSAFVDSMDEHFGNVKTKALKYCYRSARDILHASIALVGNATDVREMVAVREGGGVYLKELNDEVAEANFVAKSIRTVLASNPKLKMKDIAILSRQWSDTRIIESALANENIPYIIAKKDRRRKWDTPEVVAMVGYFRAIQSIRDAEGARPDLGGALDVVLNYPPRGIGPTSHDIILDGEPELDWEGLILAMTSANLRRQVRDELKKLFELLLKLAQSDIQKPVDLAKAILEETQWLEEISEELDFYKVRGLLEDDLMQEIAKHSTIPGFLSMAYEQMGDNWNLDGVNLSSVHAAKGLEWKVVYIFGMNEGTFPSAQATGSDDANEEARVAHVATSRAMDVLFCTWSRTRTRNKRRKPVMPSRFLAGIKPYGKEYDDENFVYPGTGSSSGIPVRNPFKHKEEGNETLFG